MCSEQYQKHLLIIEDDRGSRQLLLEKPIYSIGRDRECDIRLASFFVSRRHALLVQVPAAQGDCGYRIVDGDIDGQLSANGLLVNGQQMKSHDLRNEDKVVFGPQVQFTYYRLQRDPTTIALPSDEDDVTLINPRTAGSRHADFVKSGSSLELSAFLFGKSLQRKNLIRERRRLYARQFRVFLPQYAKV